MKRRFVLMLVACVMVLILPGTVLSQDPERRPAIAVLGEAEVDPPNASAYVSAIDPDTNAAYIDLATDRFMVELSGRDVPPGDIDLEGVKTGLAAVLVVDRGGISRQGDERIYNAVITLQYMIDLLLNVDGSEGADMVALIGIRDEGHGGLTPFVNFTDSDEASVLGGLESMLAEAVPESTPLYDGVDMAIDLITENPDPEVQDKLAHRRPVIFLASDGIEPGKSDKAHEAVIVSRCLEHGIPIYAIEMVQARPQRAPGMALFAKQTNGFSYPYYGREDAETLQITTDLLTAIATQRQAYKVTFPVRLYAGAYRARVRIADLGETAEFDVSSRLLPPQIELGSPEGGNAYIVRYSEDQGAYAPAPVGLSAQIRPTDGVDRYPDEVRYFADGKHVATGTIPPAFQAEWDMAQVYAPAPYVRAENWTLTAEVDDPYLNTRVGSLPVTVRISWEPSPQGAVPPDLDQTPEPTNVAPPPAPDGPCWDDPAECVAQNWWVPLLAVLAIAFLVLLVLVLRRSRGHGERPSQREMRPRQAMAPAADARAVAADSQPKGAGEAGSAEEQERAQS